MGGGSHRRRLRTRGGEYPHPGDQGSAEPASLRGQRTDGDDVGQGFLAALAPGIWSRTRVPARVIDLPINGRHARSRYEAEVNVL